VGLLSIRLEALPELEARVVRYRRRLRFGSPAANPLMLEPHHQ
jgi:hypothetical protein